MREKMIAEAGKRGVAILKGWALKED